MRKTSPATATTAATPTDTDRVAPYAHCLGCATALAQLVTEARQAGHAAGLKEAADDAHAAGYREGYEVGLAEGQDDAHRTGYLEGRSSLHIDESTGDR